MLGDPVEVPYPTFGDGSSVPVCTGTLVCIGELIGVPVVAPEMQKKIDEDFFETLDTREKNAYVDPKEKENIEAALTSPTPPSQQAIDEALLMLAKEPTYTSAKIDLLLGGNQLSQKVKPSQDAIDGAITVAAAQLISLPDDHLVASATKSLSQRNACYTLQYLVAASDRLSADASAGLEQALDVVPKSLLAAINLKNAIEKKDINKWCDAEKERTGGGAVARG